MEGMKRWVMFAVCLSLQALAWEAPVAHAQQGPRPGPGARDFRGPPPGRDAPRRDFDRMPPADRGDRELMRQQQWERRQMMSPEERRQLRRDIGDHGREVYGERGRQ